MDDTAAGAPAAFEQMILPHLDAAYNLARWLLRHEQDAEDAVQDACLRAHRAFAGFRGTDGRAWLLTIVRHVCYSHLRRLGRLPATEAFTDDAHGADTAQAEVNARAWREVRGEMLARALGELPPEAREVIVLHEIEGLAYRKIAEVIQVPLGTVMSRLSRARLKLQQQLLALRATEPAP